MSSPATAASSVAVHNVAAAADLARVPGGHDRAAPGVDEIGEINEQQHVSQVEALADGAPDPDDVVVVPRITCTA